MCYVPLTYNIATASVGNESPVVKRIGGDNKILTSIEVSKKSFSKAETVILVSYNEVIDALGGTLLAVKLKAPILMTDEKRLKSEIIPELKRLNTKNVIILGGEKAVPKEIADFLEASYNVERIGGRNRESTAIDIAKKAMGGKAEEVFISLGYEVYADALSIGPVTAKLDKPLLLSQKKKLSEDTIRALEDLEVNKVTIVGGEKVVSKSVEDKLKSKGLIVDRIKGYNREETSVKIAEKYSKDPDRIIMASGYNFADSVVGGYYAHRKNAPIILSKKDRLADSTFKYISEMRKGVDILGLYKVINLNVETDLNIILKTQKFKNQFFILPKVVSYNTVEANKMIDRIMNISPKIISNIYNAGVRMKLCKGPITSEPEYRDLKGVVPRGWEGLGKTWDDVPGAGGTLVPIARIGYSDPSDRTGHGSANLELHEIAHTIDNYITGTYPGVGLSLSNKFISIWEKEVIGVLPDIYYIDYVEEYFAEAFALYHLNESTKNNLKKKAPQTYAFIKSLDSIKLGSSIRMMNNIENLVDLEDIIIQEEPFY